MRDHSFISLSSITNKLTYALVAIAALGAMSSAQAKVLFTDTSISALYGTDYELVPQETLTTVTLEHASTHTWGGVFFFVDRHQGKENAAGKEFKETYGELAPKLKLAKFDNSFIKQVNLAGQYEFGSNSNGFTLTYGWEKNNFVIDGYVDYAFNSEDDSVKDNIHINPQLKYNLQEVLGIDNRLEVGMEYSYWKNKFGSDKTQNAASALVKFHF